MTTGDGGIKAGVCVPSSDEFVERGEGSAFVSLPDRSR